MPTLHFDQIYPPILSLTLLILLNSISYGHVLCLFPPRFVNHWAYLMLPIMYVGVRSSTEEWKKEVFSMALATEGVFLMDKAV